jgi:hypothetical protein
MATLYFRRSHVPVVSSPSVTLVDIDWIWRVLWKHSSYLTGSISPLQSPASQCYVRFDVFTAMTMKNAVFWDVKTPVLTSHETHYVAATGPSRLMLCRIWSSHGGDYEECWLLGYGNPVHTSLETRFVSATEPSRWILCKIWVFHGGMYEEYRILGCYAVWLFL